jgi:hypothetical protein
MLVALHRQEELLKDIYQNGVLFFHLNLLKSLPYIEHYLYFGLIWTLRRQNKI